MNDNQRRTRRMPRRNFENLGDHKNSDNHYGSNDHSAGKLEPVFCRKPKFKQVLKPKSETDDEKDKCESTTSFKMSPSFELTGPIKLLEQLKKSRNADKPIEELQTKETCRVLRSGFFKNPQNQRTIQSLQECNKITSFFEAKYGEHEGKGTSFNTLLSRYHDSPIKLLEHLKSKNDSELIEELQTNKNEFEQVLNDFDIYIGLDCIADIIEVVARALSSVPFLSKVKKSALLSTGLKGYYYKLCQDFELLNQDKDKCCFYHSITILKAILETFPSSHHEILPLLSLVTSLIKDSKIIFQEETITVFEQLTKLSLRERDRELQIKKSRVRKMVGPPPENFRDLSIFPERNLDLMTDKEPFLRPIDLENGFDSVEDYLDIHFRLLKEDFVRPLRNGIKEYLYNEKDSAVKKRFSDIKVYYGVHILELVCLKTDLCHIVKFNTKPLKNVKWESSKRFTYGSLLCLTNNDFKDIFFATVADRDTKELSEGILKVKFETKHDELDRIPLSDTFIMIETSAAYFEAYRHVLKALQLMMPSDIPFQNTIIHGARVKEAPKYAIASELITYDFSQLCSKMKTSSYSRTAVRTSCLEETDISEEDDCPSSKAPIRTSCLEETDISDEDDCPSTKTPIRTSCLEETDISYDDCSSAKIAVRTSYLKETDISEEDCPSANTSVRTNCLEEVNIFEEVRNSCLEETDTSDEEDCPSSKRLFRTSYLIETDTSDEDRCPSSKMLDKTCHLKEIDIFDEDNWPSAETLGLDESQKKALVASLTSNVALVQGPPGTGKTFIGLKIVQVLIHNWAKWNINNRPILVICYTNHALDQFLEGISKFLTSQIVRVGGRSKNRAMEKFLLRNMRLKFSKRHIYEEMDVLTCEINGSIKAMKEIHGSICSEDILQPFIDKHHLKSLFLNPLFFNSSSKSSQIVKWLQQDFAKVEETQNTGVKNKTYVDKKSRAKVEANHIQNRADEKTKHVNQYLLETEAMTPEKVKTVRNVWTLNLIQRWKLYKFWKNKYIKFETNKIAVAKRKYQMLVEELKVLQNEEDKSLMERAKIIGITTTAAAKYHEVLRKIGPKIVIVEEAAEVFESHVTTNLSSGCEHLILIGDHKQLRPNPTVYKLGTEYNLNCSLFERLIINKVPFVTLEHQHRMRPQISDFARLIYPNLEDDDSVQNYENILGIGSNVFFISHNQEESKDVELMSKSNHHEAAFLARLCKYLIQQGYSPEQITILTPYAGQMFTIRKCMPRQFCQEVRVCPIDNYQGEENDIILLSLVRSNTEGCIGFLKEDNRMCVAMTRAKKGLYVIGNFEMLRCGSPLIEKIYKKALENQPPIVGCELSLYCQNHPKTLHLVSCHDDFDKIPEGGCMLQCQFRLPCGHTCTRACHGYDRDHKTFRCIKPCTKIICSENHLCPKACYEECGKCKQPCTKIVCSENHLCTKRCFEDCGECKQPCTKIVCSENHLCTKTYHEDCGRCEAKVVRTLPSCSHSQTMKCYQSVETFVCQAKCNFKLACGHNCVEPCGKRHTNKCRVQVSKLLECGHRRMEPCSEISTKKCGVQVSKLLKCGHLIRVMCSKFLDNDHNCTFPCKTILECGHICPGSCGLCFEGRVHIQCNRKCERNLVCGHKCMSSCSKDCPPCSVKCETKCSHSACQKKCGEPCVPCTEICTWECEHYACTELCGQSCNRLRCNEPCQNILECKHKCAGLCGEPCPKLCAQCNKKILCHNENKSSARFVQLSDCGHVLEVKGLDKWIDEGSSSSSSITPICCPKCKTPIRNSIRYGPEINSVLNKIEKVKSKIFGNATELELKKEELQRKLQKSVVASLHYIPIYLRKNFHSLGQLVSANAAVDFLKHIEKCTDKFPKQKSYLKKLENVITQNIFNLSPQQLDELQFELTRIDLLVMFEKYKEHFEIVSHERLTEDHKTTFSAVVTELEKCKLNKELERRARALLKETSSLTADLEITEVERIEIDNALTDLQRCAWYECPNGHVCAIDARGGATTMESKCNECGASVTGGSRVLRRNYRWNNRVDKSLLPTAWPKTGRHRSMQARNKPIQARNKSMQARNKPVQAKHKPM